MRCCGSGGAGESDEVAVRIRHDEGERAPGFAQQRPDVLEGEGGRQGIGLPMPEVPREDRAVDAPQVQAAAATHDLCVERRVAVGGGDLEAELVRIA